MKNRKPLLSPRTVERFWSKVDKSGGPRACWPWVGGWRDRRGYGMFSVQFVVGGKSRNMFASRFALYLETGEIGEMALHSCDNPPCCNPSHLRWGSCADNMRDAVERGRIKAGDTHGTHTHPDSVSRAAEHWNFGGKTQEISTGRFSTKDGFSNRMISAFGETKTLSDWARFVGMGRSALWIRIYRLGWDAERALTFGTEYRGRVCA